MAEPIVEDLPGSRAAGAPDRSRSSLWHHSDFLKLWGGETVSQIGTQVTVLALPLTAIVTLGAGPRELGFLTALQFVPVVAITLFAGVWLDTHRRRPALVVTSLARAVLLALIPLLFLLGGLSLGALYVITFLVGLFTAVADVAYLVYLPSLVTRDQLVEANSRLEATYSISQIGGPGIGGFLVQVLTAPVAILVDAVSYLLAAAGFGWIRRPEPEPATRPMAARSVLADISAGLSLILRNPVLCPLAIQAAVFNLFEQVALTLYLLYGIRNLGLSPGLLGIILASGSVGALAGTVVAKRLAAVLGSGRATVLSMVCSSAALLLLPLAAGAPLTASTVLVAGFVVYGFGLAVFNVLSLSLRTALVPAGLLGRVTATFRFVVYGTIPLGALLAGFLGEAFGVRAGMVIGLAPLLVAAVLFLFTRVRTAEIGEEPTAAPSP